MYILSVLSLHLRQLPLSGWRGWPGGTPRRAVSPDASDPTAWWPKHRAACGMTENTTLSKYLFLLDLVGKCWYFVCLTRGGKFSEAELLTVECDCLWNESWQYPQMMQFRWIDDRNLEKLPSWVAWLKQSQPTSQSSGGCAQKIFVFDCWILPRWGQKTKNMWEQQPSNLDDSLRNPQVPVLPPKLPGSTTHTAHLLKHAEPTGWIRCSVHAILALQRRRPRMRCRRKRHWPSSASTRWDKPGLNSCIEHQCTTQIKTIYFHMFAYRSSDSGKDQHVWFKWLNRLCWN